MPHVTSVFISKRLQTPSSSMIDVEDRPRCERQERDRHDFAHPRLAQQRPEERRSTADQAEQCEEAPARTLGVPGERGDDAEAFRRVVQAEADHEHERETDLILCRGLADREPFGEVMEPDPRSDHDR